MFIVSLLKLFVQIYSWPDNYITSTFNVINSQYNALGKLNITVNQHRTRLTITGQHKKRFSHCCCRPRWKYLLDFYFVFTFFSFVKQRKLYLTLFYSRGRLMNKFQWIVSEIIMHTSTIFHLHLHCDFYYE